MARIGGDKKFPSTLANAIIRTRFNQIGLSLDGAASILVLPTRTYYHPMLIQRAVSERKTWHRLISERQRADCPQVPLFA